MCIIVEHVWTIIVQFKKLIIYYNHGDFLYYFNKLVIRLGNLLITSYEFLWKKKMLIIVMLDVVKRNPLFLHEIEWKNNEFLFTTPNIISDTLCYNYH